MQRGSLFHQLTPCPMIQVWGQGGQRLEVHQPKWGMFPQIKQGMYLIPLYVRVTR